MKKKWFLWSVLLIGFCFNPVKAVEITFQEGNLMVDGAVVDSGYTTGITFLREGGSHETDPKDDDATYLAGYNDGPRFHFMASFDLSHIETIFSGAPVYFEDISLVIKHTSQQGQGDFTSFSVHTTDPFDEATATWVNPGTGHPAGGTIGDELSTTDVRGLSTNAVDTWSITPAFSDALLDALDDPSNTVNLMIRKTVETGLPSNTRWFARILDDEATSLASGGRPKLVVDVRLENRVTNPSPANNAIDVPNDVTLSWFTGIDPNNPGQPNPKIRKHYVYLSKDQFANPDDPNLYLLPQEIDAGSPVNATASYPPLTLNLDGIYMWKVEEGLDDGQGGVYPPGHPNNIDGPVWTFNMLATIPEFTEHPQNILVAPGETAQMTAMAESVSQLNYQWYKSDDPANDTPVDDVPVPDQTSNTMVLLNVQPGDEGYYYCKATKTTNGGDGVNSLTAKLGVERLVAHWSMDQSDYVDTAYQDIVGGHHATTFGTAANFVEGMDGTTSGAVVIDADSIGLTDDYKPSEFSGQLTVSLWIKWNGPSSEHQRPIARRLVDTGTTAWNFRIDPSTTTLRFQADGAPGSPTGDLIGTDAPWQHICASFNGTSALLYIDGELQASAAFAIQDDLAVPIILGAGNTLGEWAFDGAIDDVRIYNYALSSTEIIDQLWYPVTQIPTCIFPPSGQFDYNDDCKVNLDDFAVFVAEWLTCGFYPVCP